MKDQIEFPAILIIEDDLNIQHTLSSALAPNFNVSVATSGEEGLKKCEAALPDVVLLDLMLPQMSGLSVLRALKKASSNLPVIMMTAFAQVDSVVEAIKLGAADYLEKPFSPQRLMDDIRQILSIRARSGSPSRCGIIGESPAMARVWRLIERFGPTDIPILLQGETGTGKGMFARSIHQLSKRAGGPFADIDCSTIPEQLAESELFGYEDGAFTGAGKKKAGRVMFADQGTLFLDEIGTLGLSIQAKLLTLIEQQQFLPLGSRDSRNRRLNTRFIAATNVPLHQAVGNGTFRGDLYHRLNGITIELPPLRDRGEDVILLAEQFLRELRARYGKPGLEFSPEALEAMRNHSWPGNVRELQRAVSAAAVMADEIILPEDFPEQIKPVQKLKANAAAAAATADFSQENPNTEHAPVLDLGRFKEWVGREAQRRVIEELQKRTNANHQELARMLRVDPKTLRSRLKDPEY
jgi:DNA-binding NtrC family response regulator